MIICKCFLNIPIFDIFANIQQNKIKTNCFAFVVISTKQNLLLFNIHPFIFEGLSFEWDGLSNEFSRCLLYLLTILNKKLNPLRIFFEKPLFYFKV